MVVSDLPILNFLLILDFEFSYSVAFSQDFCLRFILTVGLSSDLKCHWPDVEPPFHRGIHM